MMLPTHESSESVEETKVDNFAAHKNYSTNYQMRKSRNDKKQRLDSHAELFQNKHCNREENVSDDDQEVCIDKY